MLDLKAHVLHGKSLHVVTGPVLILVAVAITVASFFLNAVFAFAVAQSGPPEVRPAVVEARHRLTPIVLAGGVVGVLLAFSMTVVTRWGSPWFALVHGLVVDVMMVCYVAVPARIIGMKPTQSRRDKLWTTTISGALGVAVCTPQYLLGRVGILMLGSRALLIPGIVGLALGVTLQAGATRAISAIKLSVKLTARSHQPAAASQR